MKTSSFPISTGILHLFHGKEIGVQFQEDFGHNRHLIKSSCGDILLFAAYKWNVSKPSLIADSRVFLRSV